MLYRYNFYNKHLLIYRKTSNDLRSIFNVREIGVNSVPPLLKQILTRNVFIIHYVTKGKGTFCGASFSAGDCYYVTPGELEIIEADEKEPYECTWIMVNGRRARELLSKCDFPEHNSVFRFSKTEECSRLINEYIFNSDYENEMVEACKLEEVFYKLLAIHFEDCSSQKKPINTKAAEIADYIENNYSRDIRISDLCGIFYLSKNYLCTVFKKEYGVTPQEYLISYRMEKAKQLLEISDKKLTIAEISFSVGIENPLYFSRCFHKRFGMPPGEYRKKAKK